jgi:hypothetical protein
MITENQYIGQNEYSVNGENYFSFTPYKWVTGKSFGDTAVGGMINNIPFVGNTIAPSSGGGSSVPKLNLPNVADLSNLAEGDLFRSSKDGKLYVYFGGFKRWLPNREVVLSWIPSYNESMEKPFTPETIDAIPTGEPMTIKPANAPDLSKTNGGGGSNMLLYAGIGGGVLILIIVLILVFK